MPRILPTHSQEREASAWPVAWLIAATVALGVSIHMRDGLVYPSAVGWLAVALLCAGAAFVRPGRDSRLACRLPAALPWLLAGGVGIQFVLLLTYQVPAAWHPHDSSWPYYLLVSFAAMLGLRLVLRPESRWCFPLILLVFLALGVWVLLGRSKIDVWTAQTAGLDAMLHGHDPWSSSFRDIYGHPELYAPGVLRDGRVYLGFPYPPLTVLLDLPGHLLFGDYRFSNLVAMVLAALFIAAARPGQMGQLTAVLFLFAPRVFLVLRNGWTEPQVAMLLAATVFCACRLPRALPLALGLLLVSKQYMVLAIVPSLLLLRQPSDWKNALKMLGKAAIVGAVVSLPLALWNAPAFWHSNFAVAAGAKFRFDALSFPALWANLFDWTPPLWIGAVSFIAAAIVTVPVMARAPRSPAGFAAAVALVFLVFFSLNKFAFCNYYYFVIATLCTSVVANAPPARESATETACDHTRTLPLAA